MLASTLSAQGTAPVKNPAFAVYGGIATSGNAGVKMGFEAGASGTWTMPTWPVAIRADAIFEHHGVDFVDGGSFNIFGALGAAQYTFKIQNPTLVPYAFAGLGLLHQSFSGDAFGGFNGSSTDLGFQVGGGVRFHKNLLGEARYYSVNGFSPFLLLIGYAF